MLCFMVIQIVGTLISTHFDDQAELLSFFLNNDRTFNFRFEFDYFYFIILDEMFSRAHLLIIFFILFFNSIRVLHAIFLNISP